MIIARGHLDGDAATEFLMLGLSRENITRLIAGQPIVVKKATHGDGVPAGWEIVILFGETELEMKQSLEKVGLIKPDTKVTVDPRLK